MESKKDKTSKNRNRPLDTENKLIVAKENAVGNGNFKKLREFVKKI